MYWNSDLWDNVKRHLFSLESPYMFGKSHEKTLANVMIVVVVINNDDIKFEHTLI